VTAISDSNGNCSSPASTAASVPSCRVLSAGETQVQLSSVTTEWCVVSCNDISTGNGWAGAFSCGSRTFYFNGTQKTCGQFNVPAKSNGGYVYYFTAASDGGFVGAQWGNGTAAACP